MPSVRPRSLTAFKAADQSLVLPASLELAGGEPEIGHHLDDRLRPNLLAGPLILLMHQLVVGLEILGLRHATQRNGGEADWKPIGNSRTTKRNLPVSMVLALQLRETPPSETAGNRGRSWTRT